jgi:hypothetical protein
MTADEIIEKWIGRNLPDPAEAESQIIAGLKADIEQAVADEREACAKVAVNVGISQGAFLGDWPTGKAIAEQIRARGGDANGLRQLRDETRPD